jgi:TonB family protein
MSNKLRVPVVVWVFSLLCVLGTTLSSASTWEDYVSARTAFEEGNLNLALQKAKKTIKRDPKHIPTRLLLVEIYQATGNGKQLVEIVEGIPIDSLMKEVTTRDTVLDALRQVGREREEAQLRLELGDYVIDLARHASDAERQQRYLALRGWLEEIDSSVLLDADRGRLDALTLESHWELGDLDAALRILSEVPAEEVEPPLLFVTMRSLLENVSDSEASEFFRRYLHVHGDGYAKNLLKCAGGEAGWDRKLFGLDKKEPVGTVLAGVNNVSNPILIESTKVDPEYPDLARVARVDGQVILQAIVKEDGVVGDISVIRVNRPNLGFEGAAIEALKRWLYMPALADCTPVEVYFTVVIDFSLH